MRAVLTATILTLVACTAPAQEPAYKLFGAEKTASHQPAASIGSYARGCAAGNVQLPESGPTWQVMRLSRNRAWGNPEMIAFIERFSAEAAKLKGWKGLYIGDIGQPRGGPMKSSHLSHQIGLDVDIWFTPPKRLNLTRAEREKIGAISIRSKDMKSLNANWTPQDARLLELAARDPEVDRIFVTAPAKIAMCKTAKRSDWSWLRKIRPLYGHDDHFHVRLKCPKGSTTCVPQKPTVYTLSHGGDGCDKTLQWWVTGYIYALKHPKPRNPNAPRPRTPADYTMQDLPRQCAQVLSSR